MRWGVRRTPEQLGHRTDSRELKREQKKWDKNFNRNWWKAYNEAARYSREVLAPELNKKYGKYDWRNLDTSDIYNPKGDPKLVASYKRYVSEYETKFDKVLQQEYDKMFGKRPE